MSAVYKGFTISTWLAGHIVCNALPQSTERWKWTVYCVEPVLNRRDINIVTKVRVVCLLCQKCITAYVQLVLLRKKKKKKKGSVRRALCQERLQEKFILLIKELRMSFYVLTCYDCDFLRWFWGFLISGWW